jgi:hypothetical protein
VVEAAATADEQEEASMRRNYESAASESENRYDRIDRLAAHLLNAKGETRPATEVWDEAAEIIDARIAREGGRGD